MPRFYDDYNRKLRHEVAIEHNLYVTIEQLQDILQLIHDHRWPDGTYSDHECIVYEQIKEVIGIVF